MEGFATTTSGQANKRKRHPRKKNRTNQKNSDGTPKQTSAETTPESQANDSIIDPATMSAGKFPSVNSSALFFDDSVNLVVRIPYEKAKKANVASTSQNDNKQESSPIQPNLPNIPQTTSHRLPQKDARACPPTLRIVLPAPLKAVTTKNAASPYHKDQSTVSPPDPVAEYGYKSRQQCHFFRLPGEIRNQIYQYLYAEQTLVQFTGSDDKFRIRDIAHRIPGDVRRIRYRGVLGKFKPDPTLDMTWANPITPLYLVNKQLHEETASYIFSGVGFFVQSSNNLLKLTALVKSTNLAHVKRLYLDHITYGSPQYSNNEIWKTRHDEKWAVACKQAATSLPNLNILHINIDVCDEPLRLDLREKWVQPLLSFSTSTNPQLRNVKIHVLSKLRHQLRFDPNDPVMTAGMSAQYIRQLKENELACAKIHRLFGQAIASKILGCSDEVAMKKFLDYVQDPHCRAVLQPAWWHHVTYG